MRVGDYLGKSQFPEERMSDNPDAMEIALEIQDAAIFGIADASPVTGTWYRATFNMELTEDSPFEYEIIVRRFRKTNKECG